MSEQDQDSIAPEKIRVLIVDDHPIVRQGIKMLLDQEPDMLVCGEAESAAEALANIEKSKPDVAIVDLTLKESSGLDLIKDIKIRYPKLSVLVLSMRDETFYAERVLRAGALGYITKEEGTEKVVEGIRRILDGEVYVSEKLSARIVKEWVSGGVGATEPSIEKLTDREMQVFELIGNGLPTREIAKKLHISVKTIDSHREHIKDKLNIDNAADLLKHAIQWVQCHGGS